VRLLLDTHAFLWWITDDARLSERARRSIADRSNTIFFSAASGWEVVVKRALGRVTLLQDPERLILEQVAANAFEVLPVSLHHTLKIDRLPPLHRDPFDRVLVAQALSEQMALISGDPHIARYPVDVVW
jgi:PIN domain nuclease of toxin-antitoxin system